MSHRGGIGVKSYPSSIFFLVVISFMYHYLLCMIKKILFYGAVALGTYVVTKIIKDNIDRTLESLYY